jgi:site-specific DNA recombinase
MKTGITYRRVSTDEQAKHGYSIEAQKNNCADCANKLDYKIVEIFTDEGESATAADRPQFQAMLNYCEDHPVDAIFVWHTDRFARNENDHFFYKDKLKKLGITLISVSQPMIDESPEGQMMDGMMALWNSYFSRDLSRKTKKGMNQKWEQGDYPGWAPLGYLNGIKEKGEDAILIDLLKGPIVKEGLELFSQGNLTVVRLQEWFYGKGLTSKTNKVLQFSVVHWMLQNPFYMGIMRRNGKEKVGNHEPLISEDTYNLNQYILRKNGGFVVRRRKHDFLLRGFAYCNVCGLRYVAEWHKVKPFNYDHKVGYYHCAKRISGGCKSPNIRLDKLESYVEEEFKKLEFTESFISLVTQKTKEIFLKQRETVDGDKQAIINQKTAIEQKRNRLEDRLLDNTITREVFQRKHSEIQAQLSALDTRLFALEQRRDMDVEILDEILSFSRNIYATYTAAPQSVKQHYLKFFFDKFLIQDKKIAKTVPSLLFKVLLHEQKIILRSDWLRD